VNDDYLTIGAELGIQFNRRGAVLHCQAERSEGVFGGVRAGAAVSEKDGAG
jgi:hypothetical protein